MDSKYLYLSLLPEALIYSMLPPVKFGSYLAIGDKKMSRSPALFLEIDPTFESEAFQLGKALERCVPHEDGRPRHSVYAAIHNVLANVPTSVIGNLHLVTKDGLVLTIEPRPYEPETREMSFLYQEISPVNPRVVSSLEPRAFAAYVTDPGNPLYLPKIFFNDMRLGSLAGEGSSVEESSLPYSEMEHLRACLEAVAPGSGKKTKIVQRDFRWENLFFTVRKGFYLGDRNDFLFFPMPAEEDLLSTHHRWWNSAAQRERY